MGSGSYSFLLLCINGSHVSLNECRDQLHSTDQCQLEGQGQSALWTPVHWHGTSGSAPWPQSTGVWEPELKCAVSAKHPRPQRLIWKRGPRTSHSWLVLTCWNHNNLDILHTIKVNLFLFTFLMQLTENLKLPMWPTHSIFYWTALL